MIDTKLIIMEGLPGTGKTTNSFFLLCQLERNGIATRWIHENARPHPTSYFNEACLSYEELDLFYQRFPHTKSIIEKIGMKRRTTIELDLMEIKWHYLEDFGEEAFEEINKFDVWNFTLDQYERVALEKWEAFTLVASKASEVILLDSSLFQFQIFTFLLKNAPYERLKGFIQKLFDILVLLKPVLIYFYREKIEEAITYLEKQRGIGFLEYIYERDKKEPFYENRPTGAEGMRQFLRHYGYWVNNLYEAAQCKKMDLELSKEQWSQYEEDQLFFLNLGNLKSPKMQCYSSGTYRNEKMNIEIKIEKGSLIDGWGNYRKLIAKSHCEFYIHNLPITIKFINQDSFQIEGQQINERWTTVGSVYKRI